MEKIKDFVGFLNERVIPDKQGKIIVILGPPGSGKGTLSKKIMDRNGFTHISTGDLIRNSDNERLKKTIAKGEYVSDEDITKILRKKLGEINLEDGVIIDGFPRTMKQVKILDRMLGKLGVGLNHALYLDLDEETAKKRILKRAKEENRDDDKDPETISKRFQTHQEKTEPLIQNYEKSRKLLKVDASSGSEDVYNKIAKKLGLKNKKSK
jgi:adenylate kinase